MRQKGVDYGMKMIEIKKLIFEYTRRDEEGNVESVNRAVDDVDLDIEEGDFVAILGHNGSGKSTIAKHINAILIPTGGTVLGASAWGQLGSSSGRESSQSCAVCTQGRKMRRGWICQSIYY